MKKTIWRDLVFTSADVKLALIMFLKERDHPYPDGQHTTEEFSMDKDGASLRWSEIQDY